MNEDALGGKTLGAVAGDGIAVVEVTMLAGVELNLAAVFQSGGKAAIGMDRLDGSEVAIGDAERFVGSGELNSVADRELPFHLPINAYTDEAAGIVGDKLLVRFLDREQVGCWVDGNYRSIGG